VFLVNKYCMTHYSYADYTPVSDTFFAGASASYAPHAIDTAGMGTNDRRQTWAMTFRVGSDWVTEPTRMYQGCFRMYQAFDQSGALVYLNQGAWQHMGKINFGYTSDYFLGIQFTPEEFAPYRNRWLGLVSATSDNRADFEQWYSGDRIKNNYFVRNVLVDLETKQIIKKSDRSAHAVKDSIDFTRPWQVANNTQTAGAGEYYNSNFLLLGARNRNEEIDDIKFTAGQNQYQCLSTWCAMGSALDPLHHWSSLTGTDLAHTVESVRAWQIHQFPDTGRWVDDTYFGSTRYVPLLKESSTTRWPSDLGWTIFSRKRSDLARNVYQTY
jgi:hypothetical protein